MVVITGRGPEGGGGINEGAVDSLARQIVRADVETDLERAMGAGLGYTLHSSYSATGGEEVWYLQNNGEHIHVDRLVVSTSASGVFSVMRQTSGTAAGTTMKGENGIGGRPIMPDITAFGLASVTGSVDGNVIVAHDIGTSQPWTFDLDEYLLEDTQAIFVRAAVTGVVYIDAFVFREG